METKTLQLTEQQLNVVVEGLANLPWKIAHPVLAAIDQQINDQKVNQTKA